MNDTFDILRDVYFEWLYGLVTGERFPKQISYRKLLMQLHNTEFMYIIPRDKDRADDGINLRYRFNMDNEQYSPVYVYDALEGPCSVLEMMVALSIRCEETIMDDALIGDRTGQWFWGMITNLGLGAMDDSRFDERIVNDILTAFLYREYDPDGKGGLFRIRQCEYDLRDVEIWYQLCWYLDGIV